MARYGLQTVCDVVLYNLVTGKPALRLDTLKMTSLESKASEVSARGGAGNAKLLTWDFDREEMVKCQDALISMKSLAMSTGNAVATGVAQVHHWEILTADSSNIVTLTQAPIIGASNTLFIYKYADGEESLEQTLGTPSTTVNTYSASGDGSKTITFNATSCPAGTTVIAYYQYLTDANSNTVTITSNSFPGYYKFVGKTTLTNASTGVAESFQLVMGKVKVKPTTTFSMSASGEPTVFDMDIECFKENANTNMVKMIRYI